MPAAKEAAGGSQPDPLCPHPPPAGSDSRVGVPSATLPPGIRPRPAKVPSDISSPRIQLGHKALQPLSPGYAGHGGGDRRPRGQLSSAVPFPTTRTMGSRAHPIPVPGSRAGRGGARGRGTLRGRRWGSQRSRVCAPPPARRGRSGQEPREERARTATLASEPWGRERERGRRRRRPPGPLPPSPR